MKYGRVLKAFFFTNPAGYREIAKKGMILKHHAEWIDEKVSEGFIRLLTDDELTEVMYLEELYA